MGRLHGRCGILTLKDGNGRELEIEMTDWVIEYYEYPSVPSITATVREVPDGSQGQGA